MTPWNQDIRGTSQDHIISIRMIKRPELWQRINAKCARCDLFAETLQQCIIRSIVSRVMMILSFVKVRYNFGQSITAYLVDDFLCILYRCIRERIKYMHFRELLKQSICKFRLRIFYKKNCTESFTDSSD